MNKKINRLIVCSSPEYIPNLLMMVMMTTNPPPPIVDWVDVANDLLSKSNLTLRLRTLGDCHAAIFIALYENILGETVPGKRKKSEK